MNRIKCIRVAKGYSQAKFADLFHVDQTAVSNWENGKNNVDIKLMETIANYFDLPIDFIYGRKIILLRPQPYWHETEIQDYENAPEVVKDYLLYKYGIGVFASTYLPLKDAYKWSNISEEDIELILAYRKSSNEIKGAARAVLGITQKTSPANIAEDIKEEAANFTEPSRQTTSIK